MASTLVQSMTVGILWATVMTVQSANSLLIVFCRMASVALSIDAVASSRTSILLLFSRARPRQNSCLCPMLQFVPSSTTVLWWFFSDFFIEYITMKMKKKRKKKEEKQNLYCYTWRVSYLRNLGLPFSLGWPLSADTSQEPFVVYLWGKKLKIHWLQQIFNGKRLKPDLYHHQ